MPIRPTNNYLDIACFSGGLHPAGDVYRVSPDVKMRFPGSNYAGRDGTLVDSHFQDEIVEALLIDRVQCVFESESELCQSSQMLPIAFLLKQVVPYVVTVCGH